MSPLIGLIVVLASSPKQKEEINTNNLARIKLAKEGLDNYNNKEYHKAKEIWIEALSLNGKVNKLNTQIKHDNTK